MATPHEIIADENFDVEAHAVVVTITMPFFDNMTWGTFCEVFGETLSAASKGGGPQMEREVGRGKGHLTIVSQHKSAEDDGGSLSFYASVKPLSEADDEAQHLMGISKQAGVI